MAYGSYHDHPFIKFVGVEILIAKKVASVWSMYFLVRLISMQRLGESLHFGKKWCDLLLFTQSVREYS
jgi:hypothetical protein